MTKLLGNYVPMIQSVPTKLNLKYVHGAQHAKRRRVCVGIFFFKENASVHSLKLILILYIINTFIGE